MSSEFLIFVYGTLRMGYRLYAVLANGGAKFVGKAVTVNKYHMTAHNFPFVNPNIQTSRIVGEVYSINTNLLAELDRIEGYYPDSKERSFYFREVINVEMANGTILSPNIYFSTAGVHSEPVPSGDYAVFCKPVYHKWVLNVYSRINDHTPSRIIECASAIAARKAARKIRKSGNFNNVWFKIENPSGYIVRYTKPSSCWRAKWYTVK